MHRRNPITVKYLLGATVWAVSALTLSGCVSVEPLPGPAPAPRAERPPSSVARPQTVRQGPAREVLRPPPRKRPAPPVAPEARAVPEPRARPAGQAPRTRAVERPPRRAAPPAPAPTRRSRPPAAPPGVGAPPDVCALTEAYGGWRPGGAQARMCREAYGRAPGGAGRHRP
ncbi:hypothetical protein [Streptomyces sp. NPDC014894]|uniref:hypothetical protein n=1 Tax=Streptomyces sp. NPDC014894 TaxID=3364931 RepID=UPI0036FCDC41